MCKHISKEMIKLYYEYFIVGLTYIYGTMNLNTNRSCVVKSIITEDIVFRHLTGKQPLGIFLLKQDITEIVVMDFDNDDIELPLHCHNKSLEYGLHPYLEKSKSKGYHLWYFFEKDGVSAQKARYIAKHILSQSGAPKNTEVFPKQDYLSKQCPNGNYIYLPLRGDLVSKGRTAFIDPKSLTPYENQWDFLKTIKRTSKLTLDKIYFDIKNNESSISTTLYSNIDETNNNVKNIHKSDNYGLTPCIQRILVEGVSEMQRVVAFRMANQFKNIGMPYEMTLCVLNKWSRKNKPKDGKRIITGQEIIEQVSSAYKKEYKGIGCEDLEAFCDSNCPVNIAKTKN